MKNRKYKKIAFLITIVFIISFTAIVKASGSSKTEYTSVTVSAGDTLWKIASEYTSPGNDIRKTVYEIRKYNKLDSAVIMPGQEVVVPLKN